MRASGETDEQFWDECAKVRPDLVRIAARHAAAVSQAEDIVHDAMVRAAEYDRDRLELDRLRPFLVTVVKRLCVDDARRRNTAQRAFGHPRLEPSTPGDPGDPAELVCDRAEARWVASRLRAQPALSPAERRLVSMIAGGLSQSEIAAAQGTTIGATQSALHRVRGKSRAVLATLSA